MTGLKLVSQNKIRFSGVSFLNSRPYRCFSQIPWVDYSESIPSKCSQLLLDEECDLALIPAAEFLRHGGYSMLEWGIVSRGPIQSVLLLADCDLQDIKTVYLDPASQSSVALLKILLHHSLARGFRAIKFVRLTVDKMAGAIGQDRAGLVIGDRALAMSSHYTKVLDLGQWWRDLFDCPFVFAVWAGKTELLGRARRDDLEAAVSYGLEIRETLAREWARARGLDEQKAVVYLRDSVSFSIDRYASRGLEEFARRGGELGMFSSSFRRTCFPIQNLTLQFEQFALQSEKPETLSAKAYWQDGKRRLSVPEAFTLAKHYSVRDLQGLVSGHYDLNQEQGGIECLTSLSDLKRVVEMSEVPRHIDLKLSWCGKATTKQPTLVDIELILRVLRERFPQTVIGGIGAPEIADLAVRTELTLEMLLVRLRKAGLNMLGSRDAWILIDRVRQDAPWVNLSVAKWLEIHRQAHLSGLSSVAGLTFGLGETWNDRLVHLHKLRDLQDETAGFVDCIIKAVECESLRPTAEEDDSSIEFFERVGLVARLFLDNFPSVARAEIRGESSSSQSSLRNSPAFL